MTEAEQEQYSAMQDAFHRERAINQNLQEEIKKLSFKLEKIADILESE